MIDGQRPHNTGTLKPLKSRVLMTKKLPRPRAIPASSPRPGPTADPMDPIDADMQHVSLGQHDATRNEEMDFASVLVPAPIPGTANWGIPAATTVPCDPGLQVSPQVLTK